jgi:hypothetical protein
MQFGAIMRLVPPMDRSGPAGIAPYASEHFI